MSDWAEFCETFEIDPNDPEQFDALLDRWAKSEGTPTGVGFHRVDLKAFLRSLANFGCERCGGTGYIGRHKTVERGRCFKCFPDSRWEGLKLPGEFT